jgi:hypothetical protein
MTLKKSMIGLLISFAISLPIQALAADTASPDELLFWDTIKNSTNPADFSAYLNQYPNGRFAALAKNRVNPPSAVSDTAPNPPLPKTDQMYKRDKTEEQSSTNRDKLVKIGWQDSSGIEMRDLPTGISIGKYEVTQGQWKAVMGNNPSDFTGCGDNCPVEQVSWDDVQQFIHKLNQMTGQRYRLPTQDEWYAACQAGGHSKYCGSDSIGTVAWYEDNSGGSSHPVGQKQPNAWGLYDMSGNVWEWTSSCKEGDCSQREFRGGSWNIWPAYARSTRRILGATTDLSDYLGFRLAHDR